MLESGQVGRNGCSGHLPAKRVGRVAPGHNTGELGLHIRTRGPRAICLSLRSAPAHSIYGLFTYLSQSAARNSSDPSGFLIDGLFTYLSQSAARNSSDP